MSTRAGGAIWRERLTVIRIVCVAFRRLNLPMPVHVALDTLLATIDEELERLPAAAAPAS